MYLARISSALFGAALLLATGSAMAAGYRAGDFFSLDLSKAVLSPKLLGPPAELARVPVHASVETSNDKNSVVNTEVGEGHPAASHKMANAIQTRARLAVLHRGERIAHDDSEKSRRASGVKLAHRRGNPLDAQALDTRIQTWPCTSGGICDWKQ
jgi:hypothetical protein